MNDLWNLVDCAQEYVESDTFSYDSDVDEKYIVSEEFHPRDLTVFFKDLIYKCVYTLYYHNYLYA